MVSLARKFWTASFLGLSVLLLTPWALAQNAPGGDGEFQTRALQLIKQAYESMMSQAAAVSTEGSIEVYSQAKQQAKPVLVRKARVKTSFTDTKYYVSMDFEVDKWRDSTRLIMVFDGSAIVKSMRSPGLKPHGIQGEICDVRRLGKATGPEELDFIDPRWPGQRILALDVVLGSPGNMIVFSMLGETGFRGTYTAKGVTTCFEARASDGYNVSKYTTHVENGKRLISEAAAMWKRIDNRWYPVQINTAMILADGLRRTTEFRYDKIEVDRPIQDDLFSIESLELPPGSRLLDRRKQAEALEYRIGGNRKADEKKLDDLISSVKALPSVSAHNSCNEFECLLCW